MSRETSVHGLLFAVNQILIEAIVTSRALPHFLFTTLIRILMHLFDILLEKNREVSPTQRE